MNALLLRTTLAAVPVALLFAGSVVALFRRRSIWRMMQTAGAAGFVLVIFAHFCEAIRLLGWMGWGLEKSPGHYLDLTGAILGIALFPLGFFVSALAN